MAFVSNQGANIHYTVEGVGPFLVSQHGFTQRGTDWAVTGYVDALAERFTLIAIVHVGTGRVTTLTRRRRIPLNIERVTCLRCLTS
ncbi:MAG: hypothetical protein AAF493_26650 [Pseudomonadota bacterium]